MTGIKFEITSGSAPWDVDKALRGENDLTLHENNFFSSLSVGESHLRQITSPSSIGMNLVWS
jgi:hypothetical protein